MRGKILKKNVTIIKRVLVLSFQVNVSLFIAGQPWMSLFAITAMKKLIRWRSS